MLVLIAIAFAATATAACAQGPILMPGWPQNLGGGHDDAPLRLADLDADGDQEVISPTVSFGIRVFEHDGTIAAGWSSSPATACPSQTVVIGNLVGDDKLELVSYCGVHGELHAYDASGAVLPGWPVPGFQISLVGVHRFWAMGDIDADGYDEVVFLSDETQFKAFAVNGDGTPVPGWPVDLVFPPPFTDLDLSGLAVGDLEFDGRDEVVITYRGTFSGNWVDSLVWLFNGDGTPRPGWPLVPFPGGPLHSPIIADLDGDYAPELVLGGTNVLHALRPDGTKTFGTLVQFLQHRYAAIADLEGDGPLEVVVPGDELRIIKYASNGSPPALYVHNQTPTTDPFSYYWGTSVGDVDGDGALEIAAWSQLDSTVGSANAYRIHVLNQQLQPLPGWPQSLSTVAANPFDTLTTAMADLDGDGDVEILTAYNNQLYVWNQPPVAAVGRGATWSQFGHDGAASGFYHRDQEPVAMFMRGDANRTGQADVADVVFILRYLFLGQETDCLPALDVDDDSTIAPTDAVSLLGALFLGQAIPEAPFPNCAPHGASFQFPCTEFVCP